MKQIFNIKSIIVLILISLTTIGNAQVTDGQYQLSITNATATNNTIDVTLAVTVLGPAAGMRIYGFQTTINFNTAIINGGTISASYVGGRSAELSGMSFGSYGVATAGSVRIAISSFSSGSTSVDMTQGTTYTLGTYRISNTANWADGNANLWLQDVTQSGRTVSAVNGYPYGASTPQYAYTTTSPSSPQGLILSHLSASPYSLPLGTLNTTHFDISSFKYYPNEVVDVLNIDSNQDINQLRIYDLVGQQIYYKEINESKSTIDMSNFPSGNYILQVANQKGNSKAFKLIKK